MQDLIQRLIPNDRTLKKLAQYLLVLTLLAILKYNKEKRLSKKNKQVKRNEGKWEKEKEIVLRKTPTKKAWKNNENIRKH